MDWLNILLIVGAIVVAAFLGLYFLNRWASRKVGDQQSIIDKTKQEALIFVIDKKKDYIKNVNLPKVVVDAVPKYYRFIKLNFVQAKIGPKVTTLMCDKRVYNAVSVKKNIKVELAGMYIVNVKGMKSDAELKEAKRAKKEKARAKKADTK